MSIDAGIYNQLNIPDPMAGANAIGLYQQGKQDQVDRKNKLAALAQQQEMQGYALNDARAKDTYNKYIQHAIQDSGGDIGKMRDAALSSGHEEGILFAQHLDKVLKDKKEATKLQQFADTVKSIGQGTAGSNQTSLLMNGSNAQPTYTQAPETETERQQKIVNMLSIDPTAGAAVASTLEKPREFALKQTEAKNALQEKFNQQKEIQRQQALDRENAIRIAAGFKVNNHMQLKPMPTAALKMQQEELDAVGTASGINADLGAIESQITSGDLKLGWAENLQSMIKNKNLPVIGGSDENSRNYATFQATLEKLRNDSLRLNKGVQTEGDAQRAWNELLANINDGDVVKKRLGEIKKINERAVQLRKLNIDNIRSNYNYPSLDSSNYENLTPALDSGGSPANTQFGSKTATENAGGNSKPKTKSGATTSGW
jgi:hypothetical protein